MKDSIAQRFKNFHMITHRDAQAAALLVLAEVIEEASNKPSNNADELSEDSSP